VKTFQPVCWQGVKVSTWIREVSNNLNCFFFSVEWNICYKPYIRYSVTHLLFPITTGIANLKIAIASKSVSFCRDINHHFFGRPHIWKEAPENDLERGFFFSHPDYLQSGWFRSSFRNTGSISSTFHPKYLLARRSQMHKMTVKLSIFFIVLGSTSMKAAHKTLMKLTHGVNFINILTHSTA
jgi:hypothetical protein